MNPTKFQPLYSFGFYEVEFSKDDLLPIITEVNDMKKNPNRYQEANSILIGQIKSELRIKNSLKYLEQLLTPYVISYIDYINLYDYYTVNMNNHTLTLNNAWVNFQKKYEVNPPHNHSGLVSFVLYLEIPYDYEKEKQVNPGKDSRHNLGGTFSFIYPDPLGGIGSYFIKIDKTMIYKCLIFPSVLGHSVHPFYSSNGSRISISGNFFYNT